MKIIINPRNKLELQEKGNSSFRSTVEKTIENDDPEISVVHGLCKLVIGILVIGILIVLLWSDE